MADSPRARPVNEIIRPFRWRIAFTYALTVIEDLLELAYPWATGFAINGLLAQDYRAIAPVMIAWVLHTAIGCGRQMYDTRIMIRTILLIGGISLANSAPLNFLHFPSWPDLFRPSTSFAIRHRKLVDGPTKSGHDE